MIVALLNGKSKQEWTKWITDRVQKGIGYKTPTEMPSPFRKGGGTNSPFAVRPAPGPGLASSLANAIGGNSAIFTGAGGSDAGLDPSNDASGLGHVILNTVAQMSPEDEDDDEVEDSTAFQAQLRQEGAREKDGDSVMKSADDTPKHPVELKASPAHTDSALSDPEGFLDKVRSSIFGSVLNLTLVLSTE